MCSLVSVPRRPTHKLTIDLQALMNCVSAQRPNIAPICQDVLDRMNRDNLGVNFLYCMKTGAGVCLTEMIPDGSTTTGDARWAKMFRPSCAPL